MVASAESVRDFYVDQIGADPDKVLQQLTQYEVLVEEYGGDTPAVKVSARTKEGVDLLLETILANTVWRRLP